jgi:hypothetical protein
MECVFYSFIITILNLQCIEEKHDTNWEQVLYEDTTDALAGLTGLNASLSHLSPRGDPWSYFMRLFDPRYHQYEAGIKNNSHMFHICINMDYYL